MVADYNCADFALAADQQTDMPVDVAGKKRYLPGEVIGNDIFRRYASVTKMLQLFDLRGAQPRRISGNFVDGRLPLISLCLYMVDFYLSTLIPLTRFI
jgi:hypothetical protein